MTEFLQSLFSSGGFMPHGHCYLWTPGVVWLHVIADALIVLAYYSIPVTLVYFVRKRKEMRFGWMFVCFAIFILACGTTHLMEIWNVWHSNYWLSGSIKALTALASVPTAILLVQLVRPALALPSPADLNRANAALQQEIQTRRQAEESVRQLNAELEQRVAERTTQLNAANADLQRQIIERTDAQEALRASEEDFRASFYSAAIAQAQADPATATYLRVNRKFCEITGYSEDELLRMTFRDLTHPEDRASDALAHQRMINGDVPEISREKRYVRKDSRIVWININASLIRDRAGRPLRTLAVIQDITARKEAEEARMAAEAKFRCLVEQSLVGIYIIQDDRFVYVNPKMTEIYGCSAEELTSAPVIDFVLEEDRPMVSENIRKRLTGESASIHYQTRALYKDGAVIYLEVHGGRMEYNGQPAIIGTLLDITERKRMEAVRVWLAAIVQSSDDAIIGKTLDGIITSWNRGAEKLFGYSAQEAIGKPIRMLIPPERAHEEPEIMARIARGESIEHFETVRVGKDGRPIDVSVTISPVKDGRGQVTGASKIARDITGRRRAEAEIHQLNAELEQRVIQRTAELEAANKELEAFCYSVSHDLRAPLRAVDGFSHAVLADYGTRLPEDGRRYLQTIRAGAQRMGELIDDLLTFARLSRLPLNKRPVDTGKLVREALDELNFLREGRPIKVRIDDLPACHGDPALLKQVWVNLLSNALKYTRKRDAAIVEIGCVPEKGENVFFVRDNGTGFDMQYAQKLFGVFQRLHRDEDYEGTGVGLAIVQRVVHRHGGHIWAEAQVDRGATFYFTLPGETKP